jgi:hypothetical protein
VFADQEVWGLRVGIDFIWVVVAQTMVIMFLRIGPALWVMVRELGYVLHFHGAGCTDYKALGHFSFYMALIQISVVLPDKVDTTILGCVLSELGPNIAAYDMVSKPFLLLRQSGGMLASLVMPAVASLAAARDERGLERVKYDGSRLYIGEFLPLGLLAWIYLGLVLSFWFGCRLGYDAAELAPLMRLFLVATMPLALSVLVQMSIGLNKIQVIAVAALAGSLVNPPVSCSLTARLGVAGVIWGIVLTTLFSNLLVPGIYVFRVLKVDPWVYLRGSTAAPLAGAVALILATWALRFLFPVGPTGLAFGMRLSSLLLHLGGGSLAYVGRYLLVPAGQGDIAALLAKRRR